MILSLIIESQLVKSLSTIPIHQITTLWIQKLVVSQHVQQTKLLNHDSSIFLTLQGMFPPHLSQPPPFYQGIYFNCYQLFYTFLVENDFIIFWQPRVKDCMEPQGFNPQTIRFPSWCQDHSAEKTSLFIHPERSEGVVQKFCIGICLRMLDILFVPVTSFSSHIMMLEACKLAFLILTWMAPKLPIRFLIFCLEAGIFKFKILYLH